MNNQNLRYNELIFLQKINLSGKKEVIGRPNYWDGFLIGCTSHYEV